MNEIIQEEITCLLHVATQPNEFEGRDFILIDETGMGLYVGISNGKYREHSSGMPYDATRMIRDQAEEMADAIKLTGEDVQVINYREACLQYAEKLRKE